MRGLILACALAGAAVGQPVGQISIGNAASFAQNGVAPGSLIEIDLSGLLDRPGLNLNIVPSTVSVTFQPYGSSSAVNLAIVSVGQPAGPVIALLPANTPLGAASVTVAIGGVGYPPGAVEIVPSNFGLFTNGAYGSEPAVALNVENNGAAVANQLTHPVLTHQFVTLWGTGLGNATKDQVRVSLGGKPQIVLFAGPAPGEPGVDQINFFVSADPTVPNGCYVALQVEAAGMLSNQTSISKAAANTTGACENPLGLTASQMATLDAGGTLGFAKLDVSAGIAPPSENGPTGGFARFEYGNFNAMTSMRAADIAGYTEPLLADDVLFSCNFEGPPVPTTVSGAFLVPGGPSALGWGPKVTLSGGGQSLDLTQISGGLPFYSGGRQSGTVMDPSQLPAPLFVAGPWSFSGAGFPPTPGLNGPPAFQKPLTFSPEIEATNFGALQTVGRSQDLIVTWNPAGFGPGDVATATIQDAELTPFYSGGGVIACRAPASTGQVTLPAVLLSKLPSSIGVQGAAPTLTLAVGSKPGTAPVFSLPLADGTQLPAVFRQSSFELWPIMVQ